MIHNVTEKFSNGAAKFQSFKWCSQNEFISQFTCLQPHLHLEIRAPHTHINTRK